MFKILTIGIYLMVNLITTINACIDNMIPVAVEFGEVGCALNPICVGNNPNGNCPENTKCMIVSSGVYGCRQTELPTTQLSTSSVPTTQLPTTQLLTSNVPTTQLPTTQLPTTQLPTTQLPTTNIPTSSVPTSSVPTSSVPTSSVLTRPPLNTSEPISIPQSNTSEPVTGNIPTLPFNDSNVSNDTIINNNSTNVTASPDFRPSDIPTIPNSFANLFEVDMTILIGFMVLISLFNNILI
jgi:hypothetical protein